LGDRRSMVLAAMIAFAAFVGCLVARSLAILDLSITVVGLTGATSYLARQTYVVEVIPPQLRARAMSTLAGSHRIGLFIGPFAGALAISIGGLRAAYVVAMCTAVATSLLLVFVKDVEPHNVPTRGETCAGNR
jgi:MFS family permease